MKPPLNVNSMRAQSLDAFDRIESSQHLQHLNVIRQYSLNDLTKKSLSSYSAVWEEQDARDKNFVVPPVLEPQTNTAISSISNRDLGHPESGVRTQLQADIRKTVHSSHGRETSPNTSPQASIHIIEQDAGELLPWEVPDKNQPVDGEVQNLADQMDGKWSEAQNLDADNFPVDAIQTGKNRVQMETDRRVEEGKSNEAKAALGNASEKTETLRQNARTADLANGEIARKLLEDNIAKGKLAQEKRAKEEEATKQRLADRQERVKRDMAERLRQEQKAEEEAHKKSLAEKAAQEEEARKKGLKEKEEEEKAAKKRARRKELDADKRARANIAKDTKGQEKKDATATTKTVVTANPSNVGLSPTLAGTICKATSPPLKVKLANTPRSSEPPDARSRKSSTPSNLRNDNNRVRASMTPVVPGSVTKLSGSGSASANSRLSAQPPLRSALRQTSSVSRRSVSWVDKPSDATNIDSSPSTAAALRVNGSKGSHSSTKAARNSKPRTLSMSESLGSASSSTSKQSEKAPNKPVPKAKVQTKLQVSRDKKMKGRLADPPKIASPATREEIIITSDSEGSVSTFYEDEEDRPRNAKAGPSSKKKLTIADTKSPARARSSPLSDRSSNKKCESPSQRSAISSSKAAPKVAFEVLARGKSPLRSPAQYMSGGISMSSESGSNSESESESESESDSDDKLDNLPPVGSNKDQGKSLYPESASGEDIQMEDAVSVETTSSGPVSQSSQASLIEPRKSRDSHNDDSRRLEQDADQQLLRENCQSVSSVLSEVPEPQDHQKAKAKLSCENSAELDQHSIHQKGKSSNDSKQVVLKKESSTKPKPLPQAGGPSGNVLRPSNQRYASVAELMKKPNVEIKRQVLGSKSGPSQGTTIPATDVSISSSSDSETSDSDDEDDNLTTNNTSQNSDRSKSKVSSGVRGVMRRMFPWIVPD